MSARIEKQHDLSHLLRKANESPSKPTKIVKLLKSDNLVSKFSPEEALALLISAGFSRRAYQLIRNKAKIKKRPELYPVYNEVLLTKTFCYPEEISISDTCAEVKLESLLKHTVQRLTEIKSVISNIEKFMKVERKLGVLTCKWGFDGASGQSSYKQQLQSSDETSDANLFSTTLVPLCLKFGKMIVWLN